MRITKLALKRSHTKKEWDALVSKCDLKPITLGGPKEEEDSDFDTSVFLLEPKYKPKLVS